MLAAYEQIERVRALRLLDAAQAAAYPHMGEGGKGFLDDLLARCRGVVTEAREIVEELHWNGKVVDLQRFKARWNRFEDESARPLVRQSGRQVVNRLLGRR